jgi:hypothetical protein
VVVEVVVVAGLEPQPATFIRENRFLIREKKSHNKIR